MKKHARRLTLNVQTLKNLSATETGGVVGGTINTWFCQILSIGCQGVTTHKSGCAC